MALPDVLKFVSACKDHLHAEWASFKKSNDLNISPVCIYAIGGQRDVPAACLESICSGFIELEKILRDTFNFTVDKETPIISHDIMVGADGDITLYPERKHSSGELSGSSTLVEPVPPTDHGRKKKKPQTPEGAYMGGVEQVANYMLDHLKRLSEACLLAGNIKVLYVVLSSAALVRARVMTYKDVLKTPTSKLFTSAINRCNETIELMTQHLLNYQSDIIRSAILHDIPSHDWNSDRPYEDNERISLCIRMWIFHMQGLRNDLWRYTSPKIGANIFATIFTDSLGLLVTRYTQIEPSDMRFLQMKADIIAIMLTAVSFLPALVSSPHLLFEGRLHESLAFSIHRRMDLLVRVAAIKCAPIETLAKVYANGIEASSRPSENAKDLTRIKSCPDWMSFFNPTVFRYHTKTLYSLTDPVAVYLSIYTAAVGPSPNHCLIGRGLAMRDYLGTKTILKGLQDLPGQVTKGSPCGGALCLPHLCTPPLIPHTVYAAVINIVMESNPSPQILNCIMQDVVQSGNWDGLDRNQVWNIQRPPWHHALVQLTGLHVTSVVAQVMQSVPEQPPAQPAHPSQVSVRLEHHLSAWTLQLITGMETLADTFPASIVQIATTINAVLPPTVKPVGDHVVSQLVISAIYSIVNSRHSLDQLGPSGPITDGQWDMMVAVGERLCSLHNGNYDNALAQMTKALLQQLSVIEEENGEAVDNYVDEDVIETVCQQMADMALSTVQGQHSFGVVWEYLKRNMEWIRCHLNAPPLLTPPASVEPRKTAPPMSFSPVPAIYNPLSYHNKILYSYLNQDYLIHFEGKWERILNGDLWMPSDMIKELIRKRPDLRPDAILTESQTIALKKLKPFLKKKASKPLAFKM